MDEFFFSNIQWLTFLPYKIRYTEVVLGKSMEVIQYGKHRSDLKKFNIEYNDVTHL